MFSLLLLLYNFFLVFWQKPYPRFSFYSPFFIFPWKIYFHNKCSEEQDDAAKKAYFIVFIALEFEKNVRGIQTCEALSCSLATGQWLI